MPEDRRRWRQRLASTSLTILLMCIALVGPVVAYAGVNVVWPESTKTVDINQNPPIQFDVGADYPLALSNNFASVFTGENANASYTVTISGLSGGTLTVDKLINVDTLANIQDFDIEISQIVTGTLTTAEIDILKIRLWDGGVAPAADGDAQVKCVLDLEGALNSDTSDVATGKCEGPAGGGTLFMQVVFDLVDNLSVDSSTVQIRPINVVFA